MSRLTRAGTAEPVSRDQILRHERGQGSINFSCSADHVQDWQPYPVDLYSCYMCDKSAVQRTCMPARTLVLSSGGFTCTYSSCNRISKMVDCQASIRSKTPGFLVKLAHLHPCLTHTRTYKELIIFFPSRNKPGPDLLLGPKR